MKQIAITLTALLGLVGGSAHAAQSLGNNFEEHNVVPSASPAPVFVQSALVLQSGKWSGQQQKLGYPDKYPIVTSGDYRAETDAYGYTSVPGSWKGWQVPGAATQHIKYINNAEAVALQNRFLSYDAKQLNTDVYTAVGGGLSPRNWLNALAGGKEVSADQWPAVINKAQASEKYYYPGDVAWKDGFSRNSALVVSKTPASVYSFERVAWKDGVSVKSPAAISKWTSPEQFPNAVVWNAEGAIK